MNPSRYHPALVAMHWFLAVFVVAALLLGTFALKTIPNTDTMKIEALRAHMAGGIAILVLMTVRAIVRASTAAPARATTGSPLLNRLAVWSHYAFYVLIMLMAATGLATALLAHLFDIVFGNSGELLPISFMIFPTRVIHGYIAEAIFALIGLHVTAVIYHQLIRHDGLLRRMWFGRRWLTRADLQK